MRKAEEAFARSGAGAAAGGGAEQPGRGGEPAGARRDARCFARRRLPIPNAADYHFNLAVSLKRHGNDAGSLERS